MKAILLASVITLASVDLSAWAAVETQSLQFDSGKQSATVNGRLKGDQTIDYSLQAKAGQTMSVTFKPSNPRAYFNILPPGSTGDAIFIGSTSGNEWIGTLPTDGEYKVRTYLMRSAARRNETAKFTLTVGVTGAPSHSGALGTAPASDAKVKGTPFHATGTVPCSLGNAPPGSLQCDFGVIRGAAGNAEVHLTPPGTNKRVLIFIGSKVTADRSGKVKVTKSQDLWLVDVNAYEHYRIPEAVVNGG